MGLIRKSLFLGTGGLVSANSKKQRVAKQSLDQQRIAARELTEQTNLLRRAAMTPAELRDEDHRAKARRAVRKELRLDAKSRGLPTVFPWDDPPQHLVDAWLDEHYPLPNAPRKGKRKGKAPTRKAEVPTSSARTPESSATAGAVSDLAGQLTQLAELHAAGHLDSEEYAAAKAKLLDVPPPPPSTAASGRQGEDPSDQDSDRYVEAEAELPNGPLGEQQPESRPDRLAEVDGVLVLTSAQPRLWVHFDGTLTSASKHADVPRNEVAAVISFHLYLAGRGSSYRILGNEFTEHILETWAAALNARDSQALEGLDTWVQEEAQHFRIGTGDAG